MKLQIIAAIGMVMFLASASEAKSWRGITPLKSTRADVERLLGQPNGLGRYQFENERAYILYADDECRQIYRLHLFGAEGHGLAHLRHCGRGNENF